MNYATTLVGLGNGLRFTESPRWHDGRFWFLDIHDQSVKAVDLDGHLETIVELDFKPNGLGFRRDGSLVCSDALKRTIHRWHNGCLEQVADISALTVFCLSDGIVDSQDRLYIGDIGYNFWDPANQAVDSCVITCVFPDGSARVVASGLHFPNGMVITPDGKTLIVAETMGHRLTAFDIAGDGGLQNRRTYAQLPDNVHPDGICLDREGAVWVANPESASSVLRIREGGYITDAFALNSDAYAVMLGGDLGCEMLICSSGSHDPQVIARAPTATLRLLNVAVSAG